MHIELIQELLKWPSDLEQGENVIILEAFENAFLALPFPRLLISLGFAKSKSWARFICTATE